MGIVFEQIEGVVQKAEAEGAPASPDGEARTPRPQDEVFEETRRRVERLATRLAAD
jgi:hypothetical protein